MKNHLKTFNLILILMACFSTFTFVRVESYAATNPTQNVQTKVTQEQTKPNDLKSETIAKKNAYALNHPEKTGFKFFVLKFFTAMLGVAISALAIFLVLKLYKKLMLKSNKKLDNMNYDITLESPKDFKEAINLFLDKTDK